MDFIASLSSFTQNVFLLLIVIAIKSLITLLSTPSNTSFLAFYCQRFSDKVNKPNNSVQQQKIAGLIATLITIAPIVAILWLFEGLIQVSWLWHALLLYFSLGSFGAISKAKSVAKHIQQQDKQSAREQLANWVLRDVNTLSPLGLHKASIEMLTLRYLQQQFTIAFYFLLLGPYFSFTLRMICELHYNWNSKLKTFRAFGYLPKACFRLFLWLPERIYFLMAIFLNATKPVHKFISYSSQFLFKSGSKLTLSMMACSLGVKLGGVAMYQGEKVRHDVFNPAGKQPEHTDVLMVTKQIRLHQILSLVLLIAMVVLIELSVTGY